VIEKRVDVRVPECVEFVGCEVLDDLVSIADRNYAQTRGVGVPRQTQAPAQTENSNARGADRAVNGELVGVSCRRRAPPPPSSRAMRSDESAAQPLR
jgi:hypothetical protein